MAEPGINLSGPPPGWVLLDAKSAADSTGVGYLPVEWCGHSVETAIYLAFDHTSAAGTVLIESAPYQGYGGTWVTEATVNWSAIDKAHVVRLTGLFGALRARISSAVTTGTVTATALVATNS